MESKLNVNSMSVSVPFCGQLQTELVFEILSAATTCCIWSSGTNML